MTTTGELLALGVQHHERGALGEAEQLYRQVLQAEPQHPEALFYLGVMQSQAGQPELAVENITQAIRLRPGVAPFHCYLGLAYWAAGRPQDAVASYEQAVRYNPEYADAHNNLGVAFQRLGRLAEATACFEQAVRSNPDYAEACSNLGAVYQDQGRMAEAIASFHHAVRCKPDFAAAHNNLGVAYLAEGNADEAAAFSRQAVRLQPDYAEAHYNLGLALKRLNRLEEAVISFQQALRHRPDYADGYNDLGQTLHLQGKLREALASFEEALRLRPDFADAHLAKASTLLMGGDFEAGWREYEWRWRCSGFVAPPLPAQQPAWDGSPLRGRTLLVRAEQGLGDTLQFIRYVALVKGSGGRVIVEAQPRLLPLLRTCPGIDEMFGLGDVAPPFDVYAYLLSLPRLLGTKLANVPARVPYLGADPALEAHWRNELRDLPGFKVGICWQGNPTQKQDRMRSFPLTAFAPLAEVEKVYLLSLQKGPGTEQLSTVAGSFPVTDLGSRLDETAGAFMDTAAVLMNLDLVVTVDTALAHLAGALGVPVWVPLAFSPDWRWLLERDDCPWYPSMRLFRQSRPGDWAEVFQSIAGALRATVRGEERVPIFSQPLSEDREPPEQKPLEPEKPHVANVPRPDEAGVAAPETQVANAPRSGEADVFDPHNLMGAALMARGMLDAAAACWEQALHVNRNSPDAHNNLGVALYRMGRAEEAPDHFDRALVLKPHFPEAHNNRAGALGLLGRRQDALACFEQALRLKPDFAEAHLGRAHTLLQTGDFARGWPEQEWRLRCPDFGMPALLGPQPAWDGSPLEGRTLLVRAEQGLGDTMQFIRYAPLIQERGGKVIVEAQARLLPLLRTCSGIDHLFAQADIPPPFDVYTYMLSLPGLLGTNLATIPADIPYLAADPALVAQWRKELEAVPGFKVGIVWQGQASQSLDRMRSCPLWEFAPVAEVQGVHLLSLQKGQGSEQLSAVADRLPITDLGSRLDETTGAFMDTAAVLMNLDLVVTVDTALAHLAGALGVPVWVPLSFSPDWRWLLERDDSPWYPTMRLFRQPQPGHWPAVFERIAAEIRKLVAN